MKNTEICVVSEIAAFYKSLDDYTLNLRYEMVEECGANSASRVQWLKESIDDAHSKGDYGAIAASACLLHLEEVENM